MGEANRVDEAREGAGEEPRQSSAYFEAMLMRNAEACVELGMKSTLAILNNKNDTVLNVVTTIRAIAATYAADHLPSNEHDNFFKMVATVAEDKLKLSAASRIVVPR